MKYLHTMVRVTDVDASLKFYCDALGLEVLSRKDYPQGKFTLIFLAAPGDSEAQVELTHNWEPGDLQRRPQLRAPGLRGRRHLRRLRAAAEARRDHQSPAARRAHGLRALARQHLHRAAAERWRVAAAGAVGVDGQYRQLVSPAEPNARESFATASAPSCTRCRARRRGAWSAASPWSRAGCRYPGPSHVAAGVRGLGAVRGAAADRRRRAAVGDRRHRSHHQPALRDLQRGAAPLLRDESVAQARRARLLHDRLHFHAVHARARRTAPCRAHRDAWFAGVCGNNWITWQVFAITGIVAASYVPTRLGTGVHRHAGAAGAGGTGAHCAPGAGRRRVLGGGGPADSRHTVQLGLFWRPSPASWPLPLRTPGVRPTRR